MEEMTSATILAEAVDFANDSLWRLIDAKFQQAVAVADTVGLPPDVRRDIKQQCLLAFVKGIRDGRFENRASFRQWRVQTARNQVLKYVRDRTTFARHKARVASFYRASHGVARSPLDHVDLEQKLACALSQFKRRLSERTLKTAMLRFLEGASYEAIAFRCACSEAAARQRVRRARRTMTEVLTTLGLA